MSGFKIKNSKIMLLCTTDNMIWQFLMPHIKDLEKLGATVDCVCSKTGFWFDELKKLGFNMIEVEMQRKPLNLTNLKAYKTICKLQEQNKYDMIMCQQPVGGMLGRFIGKKYNLEVFYTAHGYFFFKGNNPLRNLLYRTAEKIMSKYTSVLVTMNEEDYNASKSFKAKKLYNIHGIGLDLSKYSDTNAFDKEEFKTSLGINKDQKIILSVSEFIKRKNYKTMLKSFSELVKIHSNVVYLLAGTGVLLDECKKLASKLGISDKVEFLGYRKDINKLMQVSDIFFHESFHEGLTMGIMEAMYFGLPVIASNVRGNADLVANELGGILTRPKDVKAQVDALSKLLENPKLCESMGTFNKEEVKKYSLDNVRQELKDIYKDNNYL